MISSTCDNFCHLSKNGKLLDSWPKIVAAVFCHRTLREYDHSLNTVYWLVSTYARSRQRSYARAGARDAWLLARTRVLLSGWSAN